MTAAQVVDALLLSKADIATLAKVRRPVVSVWGMRYAGTDRPFPAAARVEGDRELFRGGEVVEWLIGRGLGNSDTLREDLAVHAALDSGSGLPARTAFDGVTALLCLKAAVDGPLGDLDADELLDEADDLDPDDEYCFAEIQALGDELAAFAGYADLIADAAYTPAAAFESLMAQRFRQRFADLADTAIGADGLALCTAVCHALVYPDDVDDVLFVDPSDGSSDLLAALGPALPETAHPVAMIAETGSATSRLARRRLEVHRWTRVAPPACGFDGEFAIERPAVFVTQHPAPGSGSMGEAEILAAVENVVMQMGPRHHGVVIAPASALIDRLADPAAETIRDGVLRSDRLRAAIRLPEGLVTTRPGLPMALWVLGAADSGVKTADRWTVLADLSGITIDGDAVESVVADVSAAMGSWESVRAHSFHHGGVHRTAGILVEGALTPPRPRGSARRAGPSGAELAGAVLGMRDAVNAEPSPAPLALAVEYRADAAQTPPLAGALAEQKLLKVVPGNKIDDADIVEGVDGVQVLGPAEVLAASGGALAGAAAGGIAGGARRSVDRLLLTAKYPNSRYTEPGDIVFCGGSEPGFLVDDEGASIVLAPARVLRLAGTPSSTGLVPRLVAEHLRAQSAGAGPRPAGAVRSGRSWRQWEIPQLPPGQADAVAAALEDLARRRSAAADALARLDNLTATLAGGLARGALALQTD